MVDGQFINVVVYPLKWAFQFLPKLLFLKQNFYCLHVVACPPICPQNTTAQVLRQTKVNF